MAHNNIMMRALRFKKKYSIHLNIRTINSQFERTSRSKVRDSEWG